MKVNNRTDNKSKKCLLYVVITALCFVAGIACSPFVKTGSNSKPNYAKAKNWTALPYKKDSADWTPVGLKNEQASAPIDVFFVHPTSYMHGKAENADVEDTAVISKTDRFSIKYQASVFNGSC